MEALTRFSRRLAAAFNESVLFRDQHYEDYGGGMAFSPLETYPVERPTEGQVFLVELFYIVRRPRDPGWLESWRDVREHVLEEADGASKFLEEMEPARLSAWRVNRAGGGFEMEALDGVSSSDKAALGVFCDYEWSPIDSEGVYLGWSLPIGGLPALFHAVEVDEHYVRRLEPHLERQAWGESREAFRQADYEEDLLTLLVDPPCLDTGSDTSRVFLSSSLEGAVESYRGEARDQFLAWLDDRALDLSPGEDGDTERFYCEQCDAYHEVAKRRSSHPWSVEVAMSLATERDALHKQLRDIRNSSLPPFLMYRGPFGERTAEYLIPDEWLWRLVYLEPDGSLRDDRLEHAGRFRVAALGLDGGRAREMGLSEDWTIAHALAWAGQHGSQEVRHDLEAAWTAFETALRWAVIAKKFRRRRQEREERPWGDVGAVIDESDWLEGLRELMPAALDTPIDQLEDGGRGTWARIENAMSEQKDFDGPVVRLADLPSQLDYLTDLDGIADGTIKWLRNGIEGYVSDWPMSAGHHVVSTTHDIEDADELASGLDELDALF
jgi:hypothetical protein